MEEKEVDLPFFFCNNVFNMGFLSRMKAIHLGEGRF